VPVNDSRELLTKVRWKRLWSGHRCPGFDVRCGATVEGLTDELGCDCLWKKRKPRLPKKTRLSYVKSLDECDGRVAWRMAERGSARHSPLVVRASRLGLEPPSDFRKRDLIFAACQCCIHRQSTDLLIVENPSTRALLETSSNRARSDWEFTLAARLLLRALAFRLLQSKLAHGRKRAPSL